MCQQRRLFTPIFLYILIAKKYPAECLPDITAYKVYIISILLAAF